MDNRMKAARPSTASKPSVADHRRTAATPWPAALYIYVKKANVGVTPGLKDFIKEYVSDSATGRGGYLQSRGLILLPPAQHQAAKAAASNLPAMVSPKN